MKQPRVIQRFSSLLLATLLLFTAVWGHGGFDHSYKASKASVNQPSKSTDPHSSDAQLSATQFEAVVTPATTFDVGGQTAFLLPAPTLVILLLLSTPLLRHFTIPHYFFSYFRHVFGHAIAPNAP